MTHSASAVSVYLPKNEEGAQIIDDDLSEMDDQVVGFKRSEPNADGNADQVAEMMAKFVQQRLQTVNDD